MNNSFKLHILTPDRQFYTGEAVEFKSESLVGRIEILPNHVPMVTVIKPALSVFIETNTNKLSAFISNGIIKVENNEVTVLCDAAEWPEEIDIKRAEESKKRAEERLSKRNDFNLKRAENSLLRALVRLRVKGI
jgi:F-type H+-transporting ATPase subunit epsilon